jgi:hypothetical protein
MSYQTFQLLASIVDESPGLPSAEHLGAHIPSVGSAERKYARAYLGDPDRQDAKQLRRQIAAGSQRSLEIQYVSNHTNPVMLANKMVQILGRYHKNHCC